jgi:hypothetical protein
VLGEFVDPVQLQVVCKGLWESLPVGVIEIRSDHIIQFGNVGTALRDYFVKCMAQAAAQAGIREGSLRRFVARKLITPGGTRGLAYKGTNVTGGIPNVALEYLEEVQLLRSEFRGGARWYELSHDRFLPIVESSNREWFHAEGMDTANELEDRAQQWEQASYDANHLLTASDLRTANRLLRDASASGLSFTTGLHRLIAESRVRLLQRRMRQLIGLILVPLALIVLFLIRLATMGQRP